MPKAAKKPIMTLDQLKKESYLLVFMLNHEDSDSTKPFNIQKDGWDFIRFGGTKNTRSLQSMLQTLKRKGCVVNGSHGSWILTTKGVKDAEYWMKMCDRKRVKPASAVKNGGKDQTSLEEKFAMVEAELDGLRVEITMANHTNEYLDEQNNLLREENSKLKKKLEMIQQLLA